MSFNNATKIIRFQTTDFLDATEFITLAQMGPLPSPDKFGRRAGEFDLDRQFYSMALASIGITSGDEYRKAMRLFKRDVRP